MESPAYGQPRRLQSARIAPIVDQKLRGSSPRGSYQAILVFEMSEQRSTLSLLEELEGRRRSNSEKRENRPSNGQSAPSQERRTKPEPAEDNPFIAFRRYADEHISSMLQSIIGLPSVIFPPSTKDWLVFNDEELSQLMKNWRRVADEELNRANNRDPQASRRHADYGKWDDWRNQGHRYPGHAFPSSIFDAIFDSNLPFGSSSFFHELSPFRNPFFFDLMSPGISAGWPMSYILLSPYSPLHLEHHQQLDKGSDHGLMSWASPFDPAHGGQQSKEPRWREAFEDLLRIENGKDMLDRNVALQNKQVSGKDWLVGMIERGSLGAGWKYVHRDGGRGDYFKYTFEDLASKEDPKQAPLQRSEGRDTEEEGFTEMDLYDAFLRDVHDEDRPLKSPLLNLILESREKQRMEHEESRRRREFDNDNKNSDIQDFYDTETELDHYERQLSGISQGPSALSESELDLPTIISTVTTTERRTLPDGSVRTKKVVNKRFADGREESVETEEISSSNQPHQVNPTEDNDAGSLAKTEPRASTNKDKRGGWFWRD
ncbi:predicted protein [Uncinocarpus reesii 1704]|uniref:Uncharacterized protein n=1 Tax=Uncinocarpus reesii (strain UAMH 1704) TaxID=336963 RepID=C4JM47_UNCRE|nr:uncharacterized protein UREG_03905 [Uncinocarpus reesii 1704]EEP79059.1 predicted protein [Uncinocarpus reesii 1704]